jgi:Flp pilus assembly protein TadG
MGVSRALRRSRVHQARPESGAAAVEFALVLIPLIALLLGMLQFGWYFFTAQSASSAARETARRLVVGSCTAGTDALTFARNQAHVASLGLTFGTPTSQNNVLPAIGTVLRVTVTANGNIIGLYPMPNNGQVTRVVESRVEDVASNPATC